MKSSNLAIPLWNLAIAYPEARAIAFNAALIPNINSMFAIGLVSLPGMLTGQILSGVSPFNVIRYQIAVMCMIFGSSAISAACFLQLAKPREVQQLSDRRW